MDCNVLRSGIIIDSDSDDDIVDVDGIDDINSDDADAEDDDTGE